MRVMEFYLRHEVPIRETWVLLDMLYRVRQMGFGALARWREVLRLGS